MLMTMFCDASHCTKTNAAGWGAWAKRSDWLEAQMTGGAFSTQMRNCQDAEFNAVVEAIRWQRDAGNLAGVSPLLIQSDSLEVLRAICSFVPEAEASNREGTFPVEPFRARPALSQIQWAAVKSLIDLQRRLSLKILVRHVRSHRPGGGRNFVNRECDRIARQHMQADRLRVSA